MISAKRYCSKTANCFGISVSSDSIHCTHGFPMELKQNGTHYVYKKEIVSGNFDLSMMV